MTALDLRREAAREPFAPIAVGDLHASELEAARTNWRERMASEHASARVFAALVAPMMRAGLARAEVHRVAQMVEQELAHAVLCARVLAALGGEPVTDLPRLDDVPAHEDAEPLEAVLRHVISIGCCSETVAVALVATEREQAGPPEVKDVLDRILRDEIKHARLGWRLVTRLAPRLDLRTRAALGDYLVDVFDHQITFHSPFLDMPCASAEGIAVGAPHGLSNWEIFTRTMISIVVPGLERCGLDARAAWDAALALRRTPAPSRRHH